MTNYHFLLTDHQSGIQVNLFIDRTVDADGFEDHTAQVAVPDYSDEVRIYRALNAALAANGGVGSTAIEVIVPTSGMDREDIEDLLIATLVEMEYENPGLEATLQQLLEQEANAQA